MFETASITYLYDKIIVINHNNFFLPDSPIYSISELIVANSRRSIILNCNQLLLVDQIRYAKKNYIILSIHPVIMCVGFFGIMSDFPHDADVQ